MSRKDDLLAQLREMAGTPQEMATAVGVQTSDATFRRAVKELVAEGVLVAEGSTRDRSYRNTNGGEAPVVVAAPARAREDSPRKARICPKCQRRWFGDLDWVCPEHGVAKDQPDNLYFGALPSGLALVRPDAEQFARMAARAGKGGQSIGGKQKAKTDER